MLRGVSAGVVAMTRPVRPQEGGISCASMLGEDFMEEETFGQGQGGGDHCQKVKGRGIPSGGEGADEATELSTSVGQMEKQ